MLITVFGTPLGTIPGGVHSDIPITVTPIIHGTQGGIAPGTPVGMIHGTPAGIMAGTIPGTTDTADGTTTIGIPGIITDIIQDLDILTTTIKTLLTANVLPLTARVSATLHAQQHPVVPYTPGGAKVEALTVTIRAEYIRAHAVVLRQEAAPSTNAVPVAPHVVLAA